MDLRSLSEDAPESQWREPMRDKVGAEQLQQVHHCTTQTGGSDCGPEGQRSAPSGSRRAATGVRNNRRVCSETVEDHDRRFWRRWPLTWRSSHAFTVLNTDAVPCAKTRYRSRTEEAIDAFRRRSCRHWGHTGHGRAARAAERRCYRQPPGCRRERVQAVTAGSIGSDYRCHSDGARSLSKHGRAGRTTGPHFYGASTRPACRERSRIQVALTRQTWRAYSQP